MTDDTLDRRGFVGGSLAALAAAALTRGGGARTATADQATAPAPGRVHPVRLGAPIFEKTDDPEQLARAHRAVGYRAAYCPRVELKDTDRIRAISEAYARNDVVIAEVGRWCNLLDADPAKRKANIERVTEGLALADALGALCCVNIAGSFNTEVWYGPHPDNVTDRFFDAAVENARTIIDAVKPKRAKFCYEMMGWMLPDSPDSALQLLKAVDRSAYAIHLDPCNLVNSPRRFYSYTDLLDECFDKLGPWIVSCHAKDLAWEVDYSVHFREVTCGDGGLDYATYLRRLARLGHDAPLMVEHCDGPEEYARARKHLQKLASEVGVDFG